MTKIRLEINVHENHVMTMIRFYVNPQVYVEYCMNDVTTPLKLYSTIMAGTKPKMLIELVRDKTNECGKEKFSYKNLVGLAGCFSIIMNTTFFEDKYTPFEVTEARHIRLGAAGGGKDITFAFDGQFKDAILKNVFGKVANRDVETLNKIFEVLRL